MSQVARMLYKLPCPASSAAHACQVAVALWPALSDRKRNALNTGAAGLASGVVGLVASLCFVLVVAAHSAVGASEVGRALRTACAEPILLPDLTFATDSTGNID